MIRLRARAGTSAVVNGRLGTTAASRWALALAVVALLTVNSIEACSDFVTAIGSPLELDYGEGIVWQQALLIFSPRAYSTSINLPFIVFHYPPLYHIIARLVALAVPNILAAGRAISAISSLMLVPAVGALVLLAARRAGGERLSLACALLAGLLALCIGPAHTWGMLMRVDMLAIALSFAGMAVGVWADGRVGGTTVALLLCVAAVFTKQTQLPAGAALFAVALPRNPRSTLIATAVAGTAAVAALAFLQFATSGGFLLNVVGYNLNRVSLAAAGETLIGIDDHAPLAALMVICCLIVVRGVLLREGWLRIRSTLRRADRAGACRAVVALYVLFATPMLLTILKSGGSMNYVIGWETGGCALIGIVLCDRGRDRADQPLFSCMLLLVLASCTLLPGRQLTSQVSARNTPAHMALVREVAEAERPVLSDDMVVLMQAGREVVAEPSIVTELAATGRWDEGPLVQMIEQRGFSFVLTGENLDDSRRSPAVAAAIRGAYPFVEKVAPGLWAHRGS